MDFFHLLHIAANINGEGNWHMTFYEYVKTKTMDLVERWYETLDKTKGDIYSTKDPERIARLKEQNHGFHLNFCEIFQDEQMIDSEQFNKWINDVSHDSAHQSEDIDVIMEQFFVIEGFYLELVLSYSKTKELSPEEVSRLNVLVVKGFNEIVLKFTSSHLEQSKHTLESHQKLVAELSSPVIDLSNRVSLLPIVGDIDTYRARVIFDETLNKCSASGVQELIIDLSGVVIIDTMVANQIFQVMEGLKLIGTKTHLVGIRPEVAQTAVQLGIDFSAVSIYPSLQVAIQKIGLQ
ncbi:STAS domain-containing protein [Shouchella patagoniensis]|uniref:STAS domain-containing protein n=1 Tax=Shouchella patagoniensis TaxID=228576 RepID=UPI001FE3C964|nr:STAS domain-containing protein [Shouchella patagoniensis]